VETLSPCLQLIVEHHHLGARFDHEHLGCREGIVAELAVPGRFEGMQLTLELCQLGGVEVRRHGIGGGESQGESTAGRIVFRNAARQPR
jgi:hypothetical protein